MSDEPEYEPIPVVSGPDPVDLVLAALNVDGATIEDHPALPLVVERVADRGEVDAADRQTLWKIRQALR